MNTSQARHAASIGKHLVAETQPFMSYVKALERMRPDDLEHLRPDQLLAVLQANISQLKSGIDQVMDDMAGELKNV